MAETHESSHAVVRYRIEPVDVHAHLFEATCSVATPTASGQRFRLPTWVPGSYLIREFARHFVAVRAECPDGPVALVKEAKDTWRAAPCPGPLSVIATVYAYDLSVRAAYLDAARGFFNGGALLLAPEGFETATCELVLAAPRGESGRDWRVATTLAPVDVDAAGFGRYAAADYDELIDHPVEIADFDAAAFEVAGVRHEIAVSGRHRGDLTRLARDLAAVCRWQGELFEGTPGARPPFARYLFQIAVVGDGYGGLEHRASTSLLCSRDDLPAPGATKPTEGYRRLLGLASHEYFHSWHVKRIKPAAFVPYDLAREAYTRQLWAFEGFTSYYDDLALRRSGVIGTRSYLELLGRTITAVLRTPGRRRQSAAEASFDAWIKYYRPDENTPNAGVSYYVQGALIGLALDLELRDRGSSLDELMRALWRTYGRPGIGVPEDGIERLASDLASESLADFFARFVAGTEELPLADLLRGVGIALRLRAARDGNDRGGTAASGDEAGPGAWLGAVVAGSEPRLKHVHNGGPAERAGLAAGDVIVAVDGLRASAAALERLASARRPGDAIAVHAFRRDELLTATVVLGSAPHDTCWLELDPAADEPTRQRRLAWLGVDTPDEP